MSTFNIHKGGLGFIGNDKVGMNVTFKADDGREVTNYHEVESTDKDVIEQELQKTADEFESRAQQPAGVPALVTGKDMTVELKEDVIL